MYSVYIHQDNIETCLYLCIYIYTYVCVCVYVLGEVGYLGRSSKTARPELSPLQAHQHVPKRPEISDLLGLRVCACQLSTMRFVACRQLGIVVL